MKRLLIAALIGSASCGAGNAGPAFECDVASTTGGDPMHLTYVVTVDPTRDTWGQGVFVGNAGTAPLLITRSMGGMNFFEFTPSGNVQVLAIALPEELPVSGMSPGKYAAVYSRHTILSDVKDGKIVGKFIPQQFLGDCTLKN